MKKELMSLKSSKKLLSNIIQKDLAIIGDSGFIGSHLKIRLKTKYNYNSGNIDLFDRNVSSLLKHINNVVFLAGDPRMFYYKNNPGACFKNNYEIIRNILRRDFNHFIFFSTVGVYSDISNYSINKNLGWNDLSNYYGLSKLMSEYEIKTKLNNYCILRLSTPFGQNMKKGPLFDLLFNNKSYVDKKSKYSFLHIDDICNAILHVIDKKLTGCYNLTANSSTAISDLITNQNSINFISNNYVNYDSDNSDLVATGWKPKIDVKSWFIKQHENNNDGFPKI